MNAGIQVINNAVIKIDDFSLLTKLILGDDTCYHHVARLPTVEPITWAYVIFVDDSIKFCK